MSSPDVLIDAVRTALNTAQTQANPSPPVHLPLVHLSSINNSNYSAHDRRVAFRAFATCIGVMNKKGVAPIAFLLDYQRKTEEILPTISPSGNLEEALSPTVDMRDVTSLEKTVKMKPKNKTNMKRAAAEVFADPKAFIDEYVPAELNHVGSVGHKARCIVNLLLKALADVFSTNLLVSASRGSTLAGGDGPREIKIKATRAAAASTAKGHSNSGSVSISYTSDQESSLCIAWKSSQTNPNMSRADEEQKQKKRKRTGEFTVTMGSSMAGGKPMKMTDRFNFNADSVPKPAKMGGKRLAATAASCPYRQNNNSDNSDSSDSSDSSDDDDDNSDDDDDSSDDDDDDDDDDDTDSDGYDVKNEAERMDHTSMSSSDDDEDDDLETYYCITDEDRRVLARFRA